MRVLLAAAATILLVTGCATDSEPEVVPTTSTEVTSTPAQTSTPEPSPESEPEPEVEPEPAPEAAPEPAPESPPVVQQAPTQPVAPTFVNCHLADGTALMSDGTHQYMESCNESAGGPYLLEDGTSIYENHPELPLDHPDNPLSPEHAPG